MQRSGRTLRVLLRTFWHELHENRKVGGGAPYPTSKWASVGPKMPLVVIFIEIGCAPLVGWDPTFELVPCTFQRYLQLPRDGATPDIPNWCAQVGAAWGIILIFGPIHTVSMVYFFLIFGPWWLHSTSQPYRNTVQTINWVPGPKIKV